MNLLPPHLDLRLLQTWQVARVGRLELLACEGTYAGFVAAVRRSRFGWPTTTWWFRDMNTARAFAECWARERRRPPLPPGSTCFPCAFAFTTLPLNPLVVTALLASLGLAWLAFALLR